MKYVLSVLFILSSLVVYAQGGNITISQWEGLHAEQKQVAKKNTRYVSIYLARIY